jgi:hypothetical protein
MKIAIPSYNRASVLKSKTLAYLLREGYNPSEIYIFLKNNEQLELYKKEITTPVNWVVCNNQTICDKRTFIRNYFPVDEEILSVDDDIKSLKMINPQPLKTLVEKMFILTLKEGLTSWGIYPVNNLFYCQERVVRGSVYICACFCGFINKQQEPYPNLFSKEDRWSSCLRIALDGAVLRYEGACPDTTYYAKGGLSEIRDFQTEEAHSRAVESLFPHLVRYKLKKNNHPDVEFIKKPRDYLVL